MDHTIAHFEIPAKDVEKLRKFYSDLFAWKFTKYPGPMKYYTIETIPVDANMQPLRPGVNGGMYAKEQPESAPMNYISVESIDDYIAKIKRLGGKIVMPKMQVSEEIGWSAAATDPEGNLFGIFQPASAAPPKTEAKTKTKKKK